MCNIVFFWIFVSEWGDCCVFLYLLGAEFFLGNVVCAWGAEFFGGKVVCLGGLEGLVDDEDFSHCAGRLGAVGRDCVDVVYA